MTYFEDIDDIKKNAERLARQHSPASGVSRLADVLTTSTAHGPRSNTDNRLEVIIDWCKDKWERVSSMIEREADMGLLPAGQNIFNNEADRFRHKNSTRNRNDR